MEGWFGRINVHDHLSQEKKLNTFNYTGWFLKGSFMAYKRGTSNTNRWSKQQVDFLWLPWQVVLGTNLWKRPTKYTPEI